MTVTTSFPTGLQYREALFNTNLAFRDPVLRGGDPTVDPLGMPKAISGNFASVFTIRGTDGRRWAVKCFTRYVGDQAVRYEEISKTLQGIASPWKVGFEYLPDGVLCQGKWYPVLKMEWIEATGLLPFVESHLADQGTLNDLAVKFEHLIRDLSSHGIAHGDLQHGNILVTPSGELKLIDYDGMFVPGLNGLGASEIGHANYQSPLRTITSWGPEIDRFSSWVIYASLRVLASEPALWPALHAPGDETLLFHKDDFTDRDHSRVRSLLTISSVPEVRAIAQEIDCLWTQDLAKVPELSALIGPSGTPALPSAPSTPPADAQTLPNPGTNNSGTSIGTAAWLTTHLPIAPLVDFARPAAWIRAMNAVPLVFVALLSALVGIVGAPAAGPVMFVIGTVLLVWPVSFISYRFSRIRKDKGRSRRSYLGRRRATTRTSRIVSGLENKVRKLDEEADGVRSKMAKKTEKIRQDEQREIAAMDKQLEKRTVKFDSQIDAIPDKGAVEARRALTILQDSHVSGHLRTARVASARIPGIGPTLAATLNAYGVSTAADFTGVRGANLVLRNGRLVSPPGIGVAKARSLDNWRCAVESTARLRQPVTLPKAQHDAILAKFAQQMESLKNDKEAARLQAGKEKDELRRKCRKAQEEATKQLGDEVTRLTGLRSGQDASLIVARKQADTAALQRDYARRDLDRYRRIRYRRYLRRLVTG